MDRSCRSVIRCRGKAGIVGTLLTAKRWRDSATVIVQQESVAGNVVSAVYVRAWCVCV